MLFWPARMIAKTPTATMRKPIARATIRFPSSVLAEIASFFRQSHVIRDNNLDDGFWFDIVYFLLILNQFLSILKHELIVNFFFFFLSLMITIIAIPHLHNYPLAVRIVQWASATILLGQTHTDLKGKQNKSRADIMSG
jgi:hypothetical protein